MPVVLYGCETWSLTFREERRLRLFENGVLRIFGPKREKVKGNGENYIKRSLMSLLLTQYCAGDKIENEMGGACSAYGGGEKCVQGFGGET